MRTSPHLWYPENSQLDIGTSSHPPSPRQDKATFRSPMAFPILGIWPFALRMSIHEVFAQIEHRLNIYNMVHERYFDEQEPPKLDIIISLRNYDWTLAIETASSWGLQYQMIIKAICNSRDWWSFYTNYICCSICII